MYEIKNCSSIVKQEIIHKFSKPKGHNLFEHACNCNSLEDVVAISHLLCPDFIQIGEYVFVSEFFKEDGEEAINKVEKLEDRFGKNKKIIEKWVNSWSIGDLFINCTDNSYQDESLIMQFCEILTYNWTQRLKELFPNKSFLVEIGDEIMGELGLAITVYEE